MISTSISIAGTNTDVILQRWLRTSNILLYLINFRFRRLNTIAATSPFEKKNRKTTRSNAHESIEMVGIFFCLYGILMYNMGPSLFCGGVKGNLKFRWSLQVPTVNC